MLFQQVTDDILESVHELEGDRLFRPPLLDTSYHIKASLSLYVSLLYRKNHDELTILLKRTRDSFGEAPLAKLGRFLSLVRNGTTYLAGTEAGCLVIAAASASKRQMEAFQSAQLIYTMLTTIIHCF